MPTETKVPASRIGRDAEIILLAQAAWRMAKTREFTYDELTHSVALLLHEISRASGTPRKELANRIAEIADRIALAVQKQPKA